LAVLFCFTNDETSISASMSCEEWDPALAIAACLVQGVVQEGSGQSMTKMTAHLERLSLACSRNQMQILVSQSH
jgi:hypothetical protein